NCAWVSVSSSASRKAIINVANGRVNERSIVNAAANMAADATLATFAAVIASLNAFSTNGYTSAAAGAAVRIVRLRSCDRTASTLAMLNTVIDRLTRGFVIV